MAYVFLFLLGLSIGSFLGVCIHRLPRGESLLYPPSRCDACGRRLSPLELVPLLGYLLVRGRCLSCGGTIPWWYPALELFTGILYMLLYWHLGPNLEMLRAVFLTVLLLAAAGTDLVSLEIPDSFILAGLLGGALLALPTGWPGLVRALLGLAAGGGSLLLIALASRGGMGGGDVKLGAVMGLLLDWQLVLVALFLAALLGSLAGLGLLATGRRGRKAPLPFAPFLTAGALLAIFWGREIICWYGKTFF